MQRFDFPIQNISFLDAIGYFLAVSFNKLIKAFEVFRSTDFDTIKEKAKGFEIVHRFSPCRGIQIVARKAGYAN